MSNNVYANGREVSCKAANGKSVAAFPDVCFTPPQTPATPPGVPIPYPNTAFAKDTSGGSKTVKISGKETMLKNKSFFKTSVGDEAGSAPKKGILTSKIKGKAYFVSWSMDVKFEGQNVVRHLDMTTHNHGSPPNTGTWIYADRMAMASRLKNCKDERKAVRDNCDVDKKGRVKCPDSADFDAKKEVYLDNSVRSATKKPKGDPARVKASADFKAEHLPYANKVRQDQCNKAARCMLSKWDPSSCCPPQTPHHLVPKSSFYQKSVDDGTAMPGCDKYNPKNAPCICATGTADSGAHGAIHSKHAEIVQKDFGTISKGAQANPNTAKTYTVEEAEEVAARAAHEMFPQCSKECIQSQLRREHKKMGVTPKKKVKIMYEDSDGARAAKGSW